MGSALRRRGAAESREQGLNWLLSRAASSSGLTSGHWSLTWQCHITSHLPRQVKPHSSPPHFLAAAPYQHPSAPTELTHPLTKGKTTKVVFQRPCYHSACSSCLTKVSLSKSSSRNGPHRFYPLSSLDAFLHPMVALSTLPCDRHSFSPGE